MSAVMRSVLVGRRAGEQGYVAAELALGIGLLLFPVAMLVITLPTWSERQAAGRAIAREAARTVAVGGYCDHAAAGAVGAAMAANLGFDATDLAVDLDCGDGARLTRGSEVTARVTVEMPATRIPGVVSVGAWDWTAVHTEPVDRYRSL